MPKKLMILGAGVAFAGGLLMTGVAAVSAFTGGAFGQFEQKVAEKLNVSYETYCSAVKDSKKELLDQAVTDGRITQTEADTRKAEIDSSECGFPQREERAEERAEKLAEFLGASTSDVQSLIDSGKTIDEILTQYGKTHEDLRAFMQANRPAGMGEGMGMGRRGGMMGL